MSPELEKEAVRYKRMVAKYKQMAADASLESDRRMYVLLAESYARLEKVYKEEAELFRAAHSAKVKTSFNYLSNKTGASV
jgi:hypothetical protein